MCILREEYNKIIVARWFTEFWGEKFNPAIVARLAAPDIRMVPSLHRTRAGRLDVTMFMSEYRAAFPDFCIRPVRDLIAEGDQVVVRWEGGGTHTGKTMGDFATRILRDGSGRRLSISGTTILTVNNGSIDREQILFDGVAAMQQLGLMRAITPQEWARDQEVFLRSMAGGHAKSEVSRRLVPGADPTGREIMVWQFSAASIDPTGHQAMAQQLSAQTVTPAASLAARGE